MSGYEAARFAWKAGAMSHFFLVFLGGGIGAGFRCFVGHMVTRFLGYAFPWGTMIINVSGSLVMGILVGVLVRNVNIPDEVRIFMVTGVLGGFTTFSAFSLEAVDLWERGACFLAVGYVLGSVVLSLMALFFGLMMMRAIL